MTPKQSVVLNCSANSDPNWRWVEERFENARFIHVDARAVGAGGAGLAAGKLTRLRIGMAASVQLREADLLVTHLPRVSAWTEIFCRRREIPHVAYAFNFTQLPTGLRARFMRRALAKVDRFVVASRMEVVQYARHFDLDESRFDFLHWAGSEPVVPDEPALYGGDYVCAVGGEGRDYATFLDAMRLLPRLKAVVVARPHNLVGLSVPDNVEVATNISFHDVLNVMKHARLNVLPMIGGDVACGHVTLVLSMFMAKAGVVTQSAGLADYALDRQNCLAASPRDAASMARAIDELWSDASLRDELGEAARTFARTNCGEQRSVDYLRACLEGGDVSALRQRVDALTA